MSQTPQNEKKSRFQLSREVQEEFVNGIAQTMLALAENAEQSQPSVAETPFCPVTGKEYSGANMVRLTLTAMEKGYDDNRWLTFKQLQAVREEHPDLNIRIRKGEHGVTVLRPEDVFFTVEKDGKWNFVSEEQAKGLPDVQRHTLLYPFTVFNAAQIENFPAREQPAPVMSEAQRNELLERFVASSGVAVEHGKGVPRFDHRTDTVRLPYPENFHSSGAYYAAKLREFFKATGHTSREARRPVKAQTLKSCAFEEMRAEMFSMLAGAKFGLPMPEHGSAERLRLWNQTFSGGESRALFRAASEAARALTTLRQFEAGEQPAAPETITLTKTEGAADSTRLLTGVKSPMVLTDAGNGHKVTVAFDEACFGNAVLWQQSAEHFVCMEPWNGWANSVNEPGRHEELAPGAQKTFAWSIAIE